MIEIQAASRLVRNPEQVSGDLDGRVVLLSIENGEYYNMNEVGSRIWALVEQPIVFSDLVARLLGEFDVSPEACEAEVRGFLGKLIERKLVSVIP